MKVFSVFATIYQVLAQDIPHDPEALAFCHMACQVININVFNKDWYRG